MVEEKDVVQGEQLKPVTHCIFDLDGLLLDTETIYEGVTTEIAAKYGKTYTVDTRFRVMGTTYRRSAEIVIEECELPITVDEYLEQYMRMCAERVLTVPLLEGAERLLRHLHATKVPFALGTSSGAEMVQLKTTNHRELFTLFDHLVCGSTDKDVKNGKPAPDIFLVAASRFKDPPAPEKCLVFEDSPNGVQAGLNAGMQTVMVPDSRLSTDSCLHSTQVISSLKNFKPEQFGLPPFTD